MSFGPKPTLPVLVDITTSIPGGSKARGVKAEKTWLCYRQRQLPSKLTRPPPPQVAIVGRSGVGKTTLFRLLSRLYQPTTGIILVVREFARWNVVRALLADSGHRTFPQDGVPLNKCNLTGLISMLEQDALLFQAGHSPGPTLDWNGPKGLSDSIGGFTPTICCSFRRAGHRAGQHPKSRPQCHGQTSGGGCPNGCHQFRLARSSRPARVRAPAGRRRRHCLRVTAAQILRPRRWPLRLSRLMRRPAGVC